MANRDAGESLRQEAYDEMEAAIRHFLDKCISGHALSVESRGQFESAIDKLDRSRRDG